MAPTATSGSSRESGSSVVARITSAGTVTEFAIPTPNSNPANIIVGGDGALWFTESNKIGRVTTTGTVTEFTIPTSNAGPLDLTLGADSNVWFTEQSVSSLGRIDKLWARDRIPVPADPYGSARGPDGNPLVHGTASWKDWSFPSSVASANMTFRSRATGVALLGVLAVGEP